VLASISLLIFIIAARSEKIQIVANMHYFPNLLGAQVWAAVRKGNESSRVLVSALYEANVINDIQREILLSMCE
jgi:hypothetical protein